MTIAEVGDWCQTLPYDPDNPRRVILAIDPHNEWVWTRYYTIGKLPCYQSFQASDLFIATDESEHEAMLHQAGTQLCAWVDSLTLGAHGEADFRMSMKVTRDEWGALRDASRALLALLSPEEVGAHS